MKDFLANSKQIDQLQSDINPMQAELEQMQMLRNLQA